MAESVILFHASLGIHCFASRIRNRRAQSVILFHAPTATRTEVRYSFTFYFQIIVLLWLFEAGRPEVRYSFTPARAGAKFERRGRRERARNVSYVKMHTNCTSQFVRLLLLKRHRTPFSGARVAESAILFHASLGIHRFATRTCNRRVQSAMLFHAPFWILAGS